MFGGLGYVHGFHVYEEEQSFCQMDGTNGSLIFSPRPSKSKVLVARQEGKEEPRYIARSV